MKPKYLVIATIEALLVVLFLSVSYDNNASLVIQNTIEKPSQPITHVRLEGYVEVFVKHTNDIQFKKIWAGHNIITNSGLNRTKQQMFNGSSIATNSVGNISLSNDGTAVVITDTILPAEINANGLSRATAVMLDNGTGAVNYTYTWTATGAQSVQKVGLNWLATAATDNNLYSEVLVSSATLQANDQLKVIYSVNATSGT